MEDKISPAYRSQLCPKHLTGLPQSYLSGERLGNTAKHKVLDTSEKFLLVPVFWESQLATRFLLKLFLLGKLEFKGNTYIFLMGKTDKHSRIEAQNLTVFCYFGIFFSFLWRENARAWLGVEGENEQKQERSFLPPTFFSKKL